MRSAIYLAIYLGLLTAMVAPASAGQEGALQFQLRYQEPIAEGADRYHRRTRQEKWQPEHSALIICDVWDSHSSVNAVRRVGELAPRIDRLANELRRNGATIIHAPSSCMEAYHTHPARQRAKNISPAASVPPDISTWCHSLPSEEVAAYPLDQSDGGNEDDPADREQWKERLVAAGRNPKAPWKKQSAAIEIDPQRDYISDSGTEIWNILEQQQIDNVILVGVHTNMCVLGRPFGLRRLSQAGKNVVLCRDLTDTMYNPARWPYANHFTGTDLIVSHIERHVCPTITSDQVLEDGQPFRFRDDHRARLVMLI